MNSQWNLFNQGLEVENWEKAQELWSKLEQEKHPQQMLKIGVRKVFEGKFKFPEVAKNDFAVAQLENLESVQINLNNNPNNRGLLN